MAASETKHRIYTTAFGSVYPHYVTKAENKSRTKREVDRIIRWLTSYTQRQLTAQIRKETDKARMLGADGTESTRSGHGELNAWPSQNSLSLSRSADPAIWVSEYSSRSSSPRLVSPATNPVTLRQFL